MKLYRNAIILGVILALLVGAYAFISNQKSKAGDDLNIDTDDTFKILELDTEKIAEITVQNKNGNYTFIRETVKENDEESKVWVYAEQKDLKFDQSKVDSIASEMSSLYGEKVIEENAADLSKYGLGTPTTVSLKLTDGTVKAVEFGDKTPTSDSYYLKEKDSNKVYTVSVYKGETAVTFSKGYFMNKIIFPEKPEDIVALTLEKAGSLVFTAKKNSDTDWAVTAPIETKAAVDKLTPMIEAITQGTIKDLVEENAQDLEKYGLKSPAYTVEVGTASGKVKVLLGKEKTKGQDLYAMLSGGSDVFSMSESTFNFVDKPLKEAVDPFVFITNIKDVSKIVVEMDGQTVTSEIQTDPGDDTDKDKFTVNGKDVSSVKDDSDKQIFRTYYQSLIGITLNDLEIGAKPVGTPEITFTYSLKISPGTMTVEFIPKDNNYYYVVKNGVYSNMIVAKSKFDEPEGVRDAYKKLSDAINKK